MITKETLRAANDLISKIPIKGKEYATVHARITAFRAICPSGTITTEILSMEDGVVTMQATVKDEEGHVLASGLAQEKDNTSNINNTSYVENCETSAVGRALGMLGIGIENSVATAEEVANAIINQERITDDDWKILAALCKKKGLDYKEVFPTYPNLTKEQYTIAVKKLGGGK